ncbi:MAG TPA: PhzF family phenazine biosynthesis protein [Solirubrobacteraceae bacterium]|nr:PhzF family phenazine biosynthesis protein [Solirubrobacteraceae bacterium]
MRRYTIADVFTDVPLEGNAVAVFTDATGLGTETMQRAARELHLSETVFVLRAGEESGAHLRVRIFTPTIELPFAGHPILGTAFVVGRAMGSNVVRLETGLGVVAVRLERTNGGAPVYGEMEQFVPSMEPFEAVDELVAALGAAPDHGALPIEAYRNGPVHVYVEFPSEDAVASLRPDIGALERLGEYGINCFAGSGTRWKTRMFGPALGVPEDPATGSAAGPLAVHLSRYGRVPFGTEIEIVQGVEIARRSVLRARAEGNADRVERVFVGGSAVVVARGEYQLD